MDRLLLILPSATYRAADFMTAAREMGVAITVASERRATMSETMGDRALTLRLSDPQDAAETIIARARDTPFAAIVGVDDQGVMAAALASERLGLAHNPPPAVARTRDKAAMRQALADADVPQPRFVLLPPGADVPTATRTIGLPCVVKPLSLSGSQGVIRADDLDQARSAAERVRRILAAAGQPADAPLLLESYLPGAEVAVEGLLRSGRLEVLAIFDKPDPLEGPYFEETLYVTPSRLRHGLGRGQPSDRSGSGGTRAAGGARARRAACERPARWHAGVGGPFDRRAVLARPALRRRRQLGGAHPPPRPRTGI